MNRYEIAFSKFVAEANKLPDTENAKYCLSQEFSNVVLMSGGVVGSDTENRLKVIGKKYGLLTLADSLTVLYR